MLPSGTRSAVAAARPTSRSATGPTPRTASTAPRPPTADQSPGVRTTTFKLGEEPWIDATAAEVDAIVAQVSRCPSGALSATIGDDMAEDDLPQGINPVPNGPYRVTGAVQVLASDGTPYEVRNRQTLCRCGGSPNKPFCNGTHWHIGFEAPNDIAGPWRSAQETSCSEVLLPMIRSPWRAARRKRASDRCQRQRRPHRAAADGTRTQEPPGCGRTGRPPATTPSPRLVSVGSSYPR